ncbi:MAG: Xaa-Pro dipeptidase [Gammaproteobacteria bacterium]|nr:MAG: Xaa-Pro dipeptidase [Gammaproteobacteria bacterium]
MDPTVDKHLAELYPAHLDTVRRRFDEALAACELDAVVIGAGVEIYFFCDDQTYPYKPNPHLLQWLPLTRHPESCLVYTPGERAKLIIYQPDDFWHAPPELPGAPWAEHFDIEVSETTDGMRDAIGKALGRTAFLGDPAQWARTPGNPPTKPPWKLPPESQVNPPALLNHLHYYRPYKTPYEIECIRLATQLSVPAHRAAEAAFRAGGSEYDIWHAFLGSCRQTPTQLPYPAIVARNRNGAVLHYQHYGHSADTPHSLLIDAACAVNGYASDITRSYSHSDPEFADLIERVNEAQQAMAAEVRPGQPFAELHDFAHQSIAHVLSDAGLVNGNPENYVERGITAAFFPHGLGHFLGIQVHEVGGSFADRTGTEIERPARYPNLRLVRTLETGQVLTIEPGLYFIDSLLTKLKDGPHGKDVNWNTVDHLHKFGGIRIEDNVVVTESGMENLTRAAFATG